MSVLSTWHSFGSLVSLRGTPITVGAAAAAEVNWASSVLLLGRVELAAGVIVASGTVSPSVAVGSSVASGTVSSSVAVGCSVASGTVSSSVAVGSSGVVGAMMEARGVPSWVVSGMFDSTAVAVSSAVWVGVTSRRSHD